MDLDNTSKFLDKMNVVLDKIKSILKKHWGILTILLIGYFFYWALTSDFEKEPEIPKEYTEHIKPQLEKPSKEIKGIIKAPYIVSTYLEIQPNGDTLEVSVWSDGIESVE